MGQEFVAPAQAASLMTQLGQSAVGARLARRLQRHGRVVAAPDALMLRKWRSAWRRKTGDAVDARSLAPRVLPGSLGEATAAAIARAESSSTALALLLCRRNS